MNSLTSRSQSFSRNPVFMPLLITLVLILVMFVLKSFLLV